MRVRHRTYARAEMNVGDVVLDRSGDRELLCYVVRVHRDNKYTVAYLSEVDKIEVCDRTLERTDAVADERMAEELRVAFHAKFVDMHRDKEQLSVNTRTSEFIRKRVIKAIREQAERGTIAMTPKIMGDLSSRALQCRVALAKRTSRKNSWNPEEGYCLVKEENVQLLNCRTSAMERLACAGGRTTKKTHACVVLAAAVDPSFVFYEDGNKNKEGEDTIRYSLAARRLSTCEGCLDAITLSMGGGDKKYWVPCAGNPSDTCNCPCCGACTSLTRGKRPRESERRVLDKATWFCSDCSDMLAGEAVLASAPFWEVFWKDYAWAVACVEVVRNGEDEELIFDVLDKDELVCRVAISVDRTPDRVAEVAKRLAEDAKSAAATGGIYVHVIAAGGADHGVENFKRMVRIRETLLDIALRPSSVPDEEVIELRFGREEGGLILASRSGVSPWRTPHPINRRFAFGTTFKTRSLKEIRS